MFSKLVNYDIITATRCPTCGEETWVDTCYEQLIGQGFVELSCDLCGAEWRINYQAQGLEILKKGEITR